MCYLLRLRVDDEHPSEISAGSEVTLALSGELFLRGIREAAEAEVRAVVDDFTGFLTVGAPELEETYCLNDEAYQDAGAVGVFDDTGNWIGRERWRSLEEHGLFNDLKEVCTFEYGANLEDDIDSRFPN